MTRVRARRLYSALLSAAVLATLPGLATAAPAAPAAADGRLVAADDFTGTAGPLAAGELELSILSTRAATVTGGDALVGVRGATPEDTVTIRANGVDVTSAFRAGPDEYNPGRLLLSGLVSGLRDGYNTLTLHATHPVHGTRTAQLRVTNHPITGPVFSGPHQEPFVCRVGDIRDFNTETGAPPAVLDEDCSIAPYVRWYYLSAADPADADPVAAYEEEQVRAAADWKPLTDPYGEYPADMTTTVTTDGDVVPAIARVETRTINRGITRIAILDDPAARGPTAPFTVPAAWNEKVLYNWGASCGIGRQQGINTPNEVLSGGVDAGGSALDVGPEVFRPAVLQGYLVPHSTLTAFGTHCNQVLSAETMMMVREHMIEAYGPHQWVMGNGASGGAIQQYTTMNSYPGLQDGGLPLVSFPDVVTTAMSPADCRLLRQVMDITDDPYPIQAQIQEGADRELPLHPNWTTDKRLAVFGHNFEGICEDWDAQFADLLVADKGCSKIPAALRYSRETKRGERCTLQDNLVHFMGIDPATGYARRPVDNVGVQYGYQALLDGVISVDEFLYLNRHVGSYDDEGYGPWDAGRKDTNIARNEVQPRMSMAPDLAADLYRWGFVTGRGAIDQAPIIDVNLYADPVPILGFHDQVRGYMVAERITETFGERETHSIWSGALLTNDAWSTMASWLDGVEAARTAARGASDDDSWTNEVAGARPPQGGDSCVVTTAGYSPVPAAAPGTAGSRDSACEQVFRVGGSPRIAAGGPTTEDVIKCTTAAPQRADYPGVTFTAAQWAELGEIFPDGVCDWTRPGVGETARSQTWLDFGDEGTPLAQPEPTAIPNLVARTR